MKSSKFSQPCPRYGCFAGTVEGMLYIFGGRVDDHFNKKKRKISMGEKIDVFDFYMEEWNEKVTEGYAQPALYDGVCVSKDQYIYMFGGWDYSSHYNYLNKYDTVNSRWTSMCPPPVTEDFLKKGYGMLTHRDSLILIGFHGMTKLHILNLKDEETWTSSKMGGTTVPSSKRFSLTMINNHQAIMFGGIQDGHSSNDAFIMDLSSMNCWKMIYFQGPLPIERSDHSAVCLGFGGEKPQLLVSGGLGKKNMVLDDLWILDINSKKWRTSALPPGANLTPRHSHLLAEFEYTPGDVGIVIFGGLSKDCRTKLNDTEFITLDTHTDWGKWTVRNIATISELGTRSRLKEKMQSFCATANMHRKKPNTKETLCSPVFSPSGQRPQTVRKGWLDQKEKPIVKSLRQIKSDSTLDDSHIYSVAGFKNQQKIHEDEDADGYMLVNEDSNQVSSDSVFSSTTPQLPKKSKPVKYSPPHKFLLTHHQRSSSADGAWIKTSVNASYGAMKSLKM